MRTYWRLQAYSNLIEITRPTVAGNVPGFRTAVASVQDRSKPFVGAMVLEMLYKKFKDAWLVELLFDNLLMWTNWIRDKRIEMPVRGNIEYLEYSITFICTCCCCCASLF